MLCNETDADAPFLNELYEAVVVMRRVIKRMHKELLREEMSLKAEDAFLLVEDWKNINISSLGELQLYNSGTVSIKDKSKDMELYFFEKKILFLRKSKNRVDAFPGLGKGRQYQLLLLKGAVDVSQIIDIKKFPNGNSLKMS